MQLAVALFCTLVVSAHAQPRDSVLSATYTRAQQLVAIDGQRRLNLYCVGNGAPTVLLDAGAGENSMVWRHVQKQIGAITRTCAYDRAGYGFSDAATRASDATNSVDDLHRLIKAAVTGPIVYVGHSIAGVYGTMLVAKYPNDVAGVVLVDPAMAHQDELRSASFTPAERAQASTGVKQILTFLQTCVDLAKSGKIKKPYSKDAQGCVGTSGYADPIDSTLRHELERQYEQHKLLAAAQSEYSSFLVGPGQTMSTDDRQMDGVRTDFGNRPLVILTAGKSQGSPGVSPEHQAASENAWKSGHLALAKKSTRGVDIVVPTAAHHIQFDAPQSVIDAVLRVVKEVRQGAK